MVTALDEELGPDVTEILEEFGTPFVFREVLGDYDKGNPRVSFSSSAISANGVDDSINWPAPNDFTAQGLAVGGWIHITGFDNYQSNGWAKILSVSALKVTLDKALTTEAAGNLIAVAKSTDYQTQGYMTEWSQKDWNGSTILPKDGMVITDLQPLPDSFIDRTDRFLCFDGADPATAKQYEIPVVKPIRTGALAPLGFVGVRA